jgi:hypothetical protein
MEATPFGLNASNTGANLDIKLQLFDANKVLINTYNPANTLNIITDTVLNAGTYYLLLSGTGNAYTADYGSLGSYNLRGFTGALPIHEVSLTGNAVKSKHNLAWNVIADEPIKSQVIEVSDDAINFRPIYTTDGLAENFTYAPYTNNNLYYRIKVTSILYQTVYSNIISLKATEAADNQFQVSTLVKNDITVNAAEGYQYRLSDIGGKVLAIGNGTRGINRINLQNQPAGVYVIQIFNNNTKQTERIIKQ